VGNYIPFSYFAFKVCPSETHSHVCLDEDINFAVVQLLQQQRKVFHAERILSTGASVRHLPQHPWGVF
jgi:hypothetical protein